MNRDQHFIQSDPCRTEGRHWLRSLLGSAVFMASVGIASAAPPIFISSPGNSTINEDGSITVQANVSDADGDTIILSAASGNTTIIPNSGLIVTPSSGGNGLRDINITPAANQWGAPTLITLTAFANGETVTANFAITVSSVNDAPVVTDDSASVTEDGTLNGSSVLANDSDLHSGAPGENNTPLTAVLVADVANGSLTLNMDGTYTYVPDSNYFGADSFTYRAVDSLGAQSSIATVSITVNSVNDAPVAVDDAYSTDEDVQLVVPAPGTLANDSDPVEGSPLTMPLILDTPDNGSVSGSVDGGFTYTPDADFNGIDSFHLSGERWLRFFQRRDGADYRQRDQRRPDR
jgi:VCBS repeat-containing protein